MENNSLFLENGLKISIDWISFTVKSSMTVEQVILFMGFSPALFEEMPKGANGYKHMRKNSQNGISVLYDGTEDMGIYVNITGSGISSLLDAYKETLAIDTPFGTAYNFWQESVLALFLKDVLEIGHLTRLDVAIDDLGGNYYSIDELLDKLNQKAVVSRFRSYRNDYGSTIAGEKLGHTIYFGSRTSSIILRVYDKKLEQNKGLSPDDKNYITMDWVRWELELHKGRADELAKLLIEGAQLGMVAIGVLCYYFRIILPDDTNRSRCSNDPKWDAFINKIEKLRLTIKVPQKDLCDKEHWVEEQVAPTLCTLLIANGGDIQYIADMLARNSYRISASCKELLKDYNPEIYYNYFETA